MLPEVQSYLTMIEDLRRQVIGVITGLPVEALNWRPIAGSEDHATNSLAVLAAHVAGSEHFWISEVIAGLPATRNRPAEFITEATDAAELVARLTAVSQETSTILSTLTETDLPDTRQAHGRSVAVRWCLLHVIDHTALHLGHMQLTYQLWKGGETAVSPRWFERLGVDNQ